MQNVIIEHIYFPAIWRAISVFRCATPQVLNVRGKAGFYITALCVDSNEHKHEFRFQKFFVDRDAEFFVEVAQLSYFPPLIIWVFKKQIVSWVGVFQLLKRAKFFVGMAIPYRSADYRIPDWIKARPVVGYLTKNLRSQSISLPPELSARQIKACNNKYKAGTCSDR